MRSLQKIVGLKNYKMTSRVGCIRDFYKYIGRCENTFLKIVGLYCIVRLNNASKK